MRGTNFLQEGQTTDLWGKWSSTLERKYVRSTPETRELHSGNSAADQWGTLERKYVFIYTNIISHCAVSCVFLNVTDEK